MHISGVESVRRLADEGGFAAKMVFNSNGAVLFPVNREHRDMKGPSISYEDDYRGNALAAMLRQGMIEVRFHRDYSDAQVALMLKALLAREELGFMRGWRATYQGRPLALWCGPKPPGVDRPTGD